MKKDIKNYICVDIETCPINLEKYDELEESEKLKLINPIDSKIIAIGIRYKGINIIINDLDEKILIKNFWERINIICDMIESSLEIVGFNIVDFDLPFIISKSFVYNIPIIPFKIKEIIDIREKINCYKYGRVKGRMKQYAQLIGLEILDVDGSNVATLYQNKEYEKIKEYLEMDLYITDKLFKRCCETNIIDIERW